MSNRSYIILDNEEITGTSSWNRKIMHNSDVKRNLDFGLVADFHNFASKKSWNFSIEVKSESDVQALESKLDAIGQDTVVLDIENDSAYAVMIRKNTINSDGVPCWFNGTFNKGSGTVKFGCDEV